MVTYNELIDGHLYFYVFDGEPFIGYYSEENLGGNKQKTLIEVWWNNDVIYDPSSFDIDMGVDYVIFLKDLGSTGFEEDYIKMLKKEFPEYFI